MFRRKLASVMSSKFLFLFLATKFILVFAMYRLPIRDVRIKTSNATFDDLQSLKSILIWNSAHRIETSAFGIGHESFLNASCPVSNCIIYTNRSTLPLENYDAIILHMHELILTNAPEFHRRPNQRFIFLSQESPSSLPIDPSFYNDVFNWTMTYKRNSDIQLLYGRIKPKQSAPKNYIELQKLKNKMHNLSKKNYASGKSKLAVWMASHCFTPSLREIYVGELKKFIDVDVYGLCGSLECPRDEENWLSYDFCYERLESKYKFYLSFENSLCNDYVTEKYFNILKYDMVPIVYGGANYSAIAPPHSYINALDYTPSALADYLRTLDENDTLYNEYFWWKDHYEVESGVQQMARHAFCDLCQKLNEDNQVKVYEDIVPEWASYFQCRPAKNWQIHEALKKFPKEILASENLSP